METQVEDDQPLKEAVTNESFFFCGSMFTSFRDRWAPTSTICNRSHHQTTEDSLDTAHWQYDIIFIQFEFRHLFDFQAFCIFSDTDERWRQRDKSYT